MTESYDPSDYMAQRRIKNELGNTICFAVTKHSCEPAISVIATAPDSQLQHRWTTMEVQALRDIFDQLLGPRT